MKTKFELIIKNTESGETINIADFIGTLNFTAKSGFGIDKYLKLCISHYDPEYLSPVLFDVDLRGVSVGRVTFTIP